MRQIITRPETTEEPADVGRSAAENGVFVRVGGLRPAEDEAAPAEEGAPPGPRTWTIETVGQAQRTAEEIVAAAREQADEIRAEVRAGEAAALEARLAAAERMEREAFRQAAERALGELKTRQEGLWAQVTQEAAALVAEMTSKVVARLVEADHEIVVDVARRALQDLSDARELHVRAAPEAVEVVMARLDELRAELAPDAEVSVIGGAEVQPGG